jgi:Zn-dependent peptidase ImmA (M78 family)/transcriptional regulator with XRE-family HTH domain
VFTASRLGLARRRRGLTKKHLADLVGVSDRSITAYEAGEIVPQEDTLRRIAEALDFPMSFFSGPDLEEIPKLAASFRSMARMTASQRHSAQASGSLALALHDWISRQFKLPETDVPRVGPGVDPETAAEIVRTEWQLGHQPVPNLIHLLEARGVRVFSLTQENREVDAFSVWLRQPFVFLNTQKSAEHSRFDAAHELGHLVMHGHHQIPQGKEIEREANQFAAAFLMPAADMLARAPRSPDVDTLIRIKKRWQVSVSALAYRLHQLGALSDWHYRRLAVEISKRGYRTTEPQPIPRETSQILNKVFATLRKEGVTKADVARQLDLHPADLDRLVFNLALLPIDAPDIGRERTHDAPRGRGLRLVDN